MTESLAKDCRNDCRWVDRCITTAQIALDETYASDIKIISVYIYI